MTVSRRQPLSMRERSTSLDGAVQFLHRSASSSQGPGGYGRMATAQPVGESGWAQSLEADDGDGDDHAQTPTWEQDDRYVLGADDVTAGTFTFQLTRRPVSESVQAAWGGLVQQPSEYDVDDDGVVSWPLSGIERAGDFFWFHYQYLPAAEEPAILRIKGSDSAAASSNVTSLSVPIPTTAEDDLILLLVCRATPPAGWDLLLTGTSGSLYQRVADGTETSVLIGGASATMAGIAVVLDQQTLVDSDVHMENPRVDNIFSCRKVDGAMLSFAVYDGPGDPPDEHIVSADTAMVENLNVDTGLYGLACAVGQATFTGTTGGSSSHWDGFTVGVVDL